MSKFSHSFEQDSPAGWQDIFSSYLNENNNKHFEYVFANRQSYNLIAYMKKKLEAIMLFKTMDVDGDSINYCSYKNKKEWYD